MRRARCVCFAGGPPFRRYVAPAWVATCRNSPCKGKAELSCTYTRRTLTVTRAATFKSRSRIVPTVARARSLPRR